MNERLPEKIYLPLLALAAEMILSRVPFPEWVVFPVVYGILFWFVLANCKGRGAWPYVIGAGTLLNIGVIGANGFKMPVWPWFFQGSGDEKVMEALLRGDIFGYTLADMSTRLPFLADVIGFSFYGKIIGFASIGDLLLLVGVLLLLYRIVVHQSWQKNRQDRGRFPVLIRKDQDGEPSPVLPQKKNAPSQQETTK